MTSPGTSSDLPEPLCIRSYAESDEAGVVALWGRVFPNPAPRNEPRRNIRLKLDVQRELFLVGELDGKLVATLMAGFDGHRGWIYFLAVAPEQRQRGFGSRLVRRAEEDLRELGCLKVNLQVRATNTQVISFYEKLGFSVEELVSMGKELR